MNAISTYVNERLHHHHGESPWRVPPPPGEQPLDGTATGRLTTKEPPLTGKRMAAVLACIAERFPQAFVPEEYLPHRPLKIGIHIDLKVRGPALSERKAAFLRYYVARPSYLRACVAGAPRIDLDGNVCGEVTAAEAKFAADRLAAILAARGHKQELIKSRAATKPATPRNKEGPPEEKPPTPRRDGLAALREAAAKRRTIA